MLSSAEVIAIIEISKKRYRAQNSTYFLRIISEKFLDHLRNYELKDFQKALSQLIAT